MATEFINIDGVLIEVEEKAEEARGPRVVSDDNEKTINDKDLTQMTNILKKVSRNLKESYEAINQEVALKEAEVELSLGFEASGNLFIAKGKATSQLKVKLKFAP